MGAVQVLGSILEAVGHTPLVRPHRITAGLRPTILAKVEGRRDEILLAAVVQVLAARETSGRDRRHEAFRGAGRGKRSFQISDVGLCLRRALVTDRPGADRTPLAARRRAADEPAGRVEENQETKFMKQTLSVIICLALGGVVIAAEQR